MHRIRPHLAQAVLLAAIACATAWAWLHYTNARQLSAGAVVACTCISVAIALFVEAVVRWVRRGRPHRAHARPRPDTRTATIHTSPRQEP